MKTASDNDLVGIFQRLLLRIVPFVCQNHLNCKRLLKPWNISVVSSIFRLSKWCTSTLWTRVIWIHPCRKSLVGKVGDNSGANSPLWPIVGILSTAPSSQAWTECVHCLRRGWGWGVPVSMVVLWAHHSNFHASDHKRTYNVNCFC